ncbi:MAG: hypothetical protein R3B09_13440 [Nannocystaceae bacterium]
MGVVPRSTGAWAGLLALTLATIACAEPRPAPPAVALARVAEAPPSTRTTILATLTITRDAVVVDHDLPGIEAPKRTTFPLHALQDRGPGDDEGSALQDHLTRLFDGAGLEDARDLVDVPRLRLRFAGDVTHDEWVRVMRPIARSRFGAVELEFATPSGVGHWNLRPYTFCACPLPPAPSWCASPSLTIREGGVELVAEADMTPPPGCHKAIRSMGQEEPPFAAALDWRDRALAGPGGGCPTAPIDRGGVDVDALARGLRALHSAIPSCERGSLALDGATPWSIAGPALAALFAEYGEVRISFLDPETATRYAGPGCASPLAIDALAPRPPSTPLAGRPGCGE